MYCPKCGQQNQDNVNFCMRCGYNLNTASPIANGTENLPKRKKKLGKGASIAIVLIIFVIFIALIIAISSDGDSDTGNTSNNSKADITQQSNDEKIYGIGDTVTVHTNRGDYSLKFTGVRETTERNEFADENPQRVVILEYEYKNISFDSDVVISYLYFRAYDNYGRSLSAYPDTSTKSTTNISQGKTATASVAYGLNTVDNVVTVDFYNITMESMHDAECTFKLTW